ncbi:MAG: hypothetical protein KKC99_01820 [Proteobacteria bacterium]|nr:hypothetical protein [Pseudomonadota bacterium]
MITPKQACENAQAMQHLAEAVLPWFSRGEEVVSMAELQSEYDELAEEGLWLSSLAFFSTWLSRLGLRRDKRKRNGAFASCLLLDERVRRFLVAQGLVGGEAGEPGSAAGPEAAVGVLPGQGRPEPALLARGTAHPIRVDAPLVLHNVAEAYEGMFDLFAGRSIHEVAEFMRAGLDRLAESGPNKTVCLELLSGAMALNGAA